MEFLWQEGHTAHATREEAIDETLQMLTVYKTFAEETMAMPVITGVKTASERFAGAEDTYCIEAMMQDGKALQAGTSHFLGQNFAKAFDVTYQTKDGGLEHVWATSWGVSTRLIGGLIMTHSDDQGLVLPPALAPVQIVIVPIFKSEEDLDAIQAHCAPWIEGLKAKGVRCRFDHRTQYKPGFKFAEHEAQGVPIRIAIGRRDMDGQVAEVARRDTLTKESLPTSDVQSFLDNLHGLLGTIQADLLNSARARMVETTRKVDSYEEFKTSIEHGGFVIAHWDGTAETEQKIKEETKATIRCIPHGGDLGVEFNDYLGLQGSKNEGVPTLGPCMVTGAAESRPVLFARSY